MRPVIKNVMRVLRISTIPLAGALVVACAPFFGDDSSWQSVLGTDVGQLDLRPSFGYYESAVTAINGRHYALALEYLQAAHAQKADDSRT